MLRSAIFNPASSLDLLVWKGRPRPKHHILRHIFAIKWLKERNKERAESVKAVVSAQQKAYNACVRKIEGLTDMRAGGELTAEEFAERKEKVLAEKEQLESQFKK